MKLKALTIALAMLSTALHASDDEDPLTIEEQEQVAVLDSKFMREDLYFNELERNPFIRYFSGIPYEVISIGQPMNDDNLNGKSLTLSLDVQSALTGERLSKPLIKQPLRYNSMPVILKNMVAFTAQQGGTLRFHVASFLVPTPIKKISTDPIRITITAHSN